MFLRAKCEKFEIQIFYPVVPNRSNIIIYYFKAVKLTDRMMFVNVCCAAAALEMQTQLEWV